MVSPHIFSFHTPSYISMSFKRNKPYHFFLSLSILELLQRPGNSPGTGVVQNGWVVSGAVQRPALKHGIECKAIFLGGHFRTIISPKMDYDILVSRSNVHSR